jgi:hypothetical protein
VTAGYTDVREFAVTANMNRRLVSVVALAVLACTCSLPADAQWKWRDKGGQMHVSDLPPPSDVPDKDVLQKPDVARRKVAAAPLPASAASGLRPAAATDPELEARLKRGEQERSAQQKEEDKRVAAAKAENCARAREQIRTIDSGVRLSRVNDKGEREVLDDAQRAAEAQRARDVAAADCR